MTRQTEMPGVVAQDPAPVAHSAGSGRRWWPIALAVVALASGAAWWWLGRSPTSAPTGSADAGPTAGPRVQGDAVSFPAALLKSFGVQTQPVQTRTLVPRLTLTGRADFDQTHYAAVGTRTKGLVRQVVRYEGERVEAGDVLAVIESTELGAAQAELASATARVEAARANAERERKLLREQLTTAREAEQAQAELSVAQAEQKAAAHHVQAHLRGDSSQRHGEYQLTAPMAGVVVERLVSVGQTVEEHVLTFRIADLTHLWVELAATERQLRLINVGDEVTIKPLASADQQVQGKVTYVGDVVDPLTGTAKVRVALQGAERVLRPGQSVSAQVNVAKGQKQVSAVPRDAVTWIDGRTVVFVQEAATRLRMVPVELGDDDGAWVEVRSGLQPGQQVVVQGVFAVKSELYR